MQKRRGKKTSSFYLKQSRENRRVRSSSFSLLELIVSLFLLLIILAALFTHLVELPKMEKKIDTLHREIFAREVLQSRLSSLFVDILTATKVPKEFKEGYSPIYTEPSSSNSNQTLVFFFDHKVDPDPKFGGPMKGEISLEQGKIFLTLSALKDKKNLRKEELYGPLDSYQFLFFGKDPEEENGPYRWLTEWNKKRGDIPPMIKLTIYPLKNRTKSYEFCFSLPSSDAMITLPKKTAPGGG